MKSASEHAISRLEKVKIEIENMDKTKESRELVARSLGNNDDECLFDEFDSIKDAKTIDYVPPDAHQRRHEGETRKKSNNQDSDDDDYSEPIIDYSDDDDYAFIDDTDRDY